jgi:hypothetical protein
MNFDPKALTVKAGPLDELSIRLDYDIDPQDTFPCLLFVPNYKKPEHFHIPLTRKKAEELRDWLNNYLAR